MKNKGILFALILVCFSFSACKKKITQFNLDYDAEVVIGSTFGSLVPFFVQTPETETNAEYQFEVNDTDSKRVKSIFLKKLDLAIKSPINETFSFLKSIEIYIDSPDQPEVLLASKMEVSNGVGNNLSLDLVNIDFKEYIKDETFTLRLKVVTDETIPEDVHIGIASSYLVDAKVIRFN